MRTPLLLGAMLIRSLIAADATPQLGHPDFTPTASNPIGWHGDRTGNYPGATPVSGWSDGTIDWKEFTWQHRTGMKTSRGAIRLDDRTRNIMWKVPMPSYANSPPVVVGKRVYTLAEPHSLVCVDLESGKILWQRDADILTFLGIDQAEQQELRDYIDVCHTAESLYRNQAGNYGVMPKLATEAERAEWKVRYTKVRDLCQYLVSKNRFGEHAKEGLEKAEAWLKHLESFTLPVSNDDLRKLNIKPGWPTAEWMGPAYGFTPLSHWSGWCGWTYAAPITDGERIYVTFGHGQTVAWNLDGERVWATFIKLEPEGRKVPGYTKGIRTLVSPLLIGDVLIGQLRQALVGYDKKTGKVLWRQAAVKLDGDYRIGNYAVVTLPSGRKVIYSNKGQVVDPKTGNILCETKIGSGGSEGNASSIVGVDDVVYIHAGANNAGDQTAVRLLEQGGTISFEKLWYARAGGGGHTGALAGDWFYRITENGSVINRHTGKSHPTPAQGSWDSPAIGGDLLCLYDSNDCTKTRASDDWMITFKVYRVDHRTGDLEHLYDNYLRGNPLPPYPAHQRWAPELYAKGWTVDPNGGLPSQYGYASVVPCGNYWIVRSCADLVCIGPRHLGGYGDDLELGKRIAASTDANFVKKYLGDSNPYYRYAAVSAAAAAPVVAKSLKGDLEQLVTGDNYPEIAGRALDAVLVADPSAAILRDLLGSFDAKEIGYDEIRRRPISDVLFHTSSDTRKLLILAFKPELVGNHGIVSLRRVMAKAATEHPELFCETMVPLFSQFRGTIQGYIHMFGIGGPKCRMALPLLEELNRNPNIQAMNAIKAIDPKRWEELAPVWAKKLSEDIAGVDKWQRIQGPNGGPYYPLQHLGQFQKLVIPALQTFIANPAVSEDHRAKATAVIKQIAEGTLTP